MDSKLEFFRGVYKGINCLFVSKKIKDDYTLTIKDEYNNTLRTLKEKDENVFDNAVKFIYDCFSLKVANDG